MKILIHIHAWNDAEVIGSVLDAVLAQTYPISEILVVDNGSDDGCADHPFPPIVTLLRHRRNLGTSGSVKSGLRYAIDQGYDWIWVLDADSYPRADALEKLVALYRARSSNSDRPIGIVASSHNLVKLGQMFHGRMLTPGGPRPPRVRANSDFVETDSVIWSGALINLAAVAEVGLPRSGERGCWEDLALDYGDTDFSYRVRQAGYRLLVHRLSVIDHPVGTALQGRVLGKTLYSTNHPPARRYLYFRNLVFFWLRLYPRRNWPILLLWFGYRLGTILLAILCLEADRRRKLHACFQGICDGLRGRLDRQYGAST